MTIASIIIFVSILFVLVVIHEAGHFIFAKLFKMRVDEFAFGFPPRLLQKKIGETTYSFNLIPLGGYVKILGENGLTEEEVKNLPDHEGRRLFGNKKPWERILVLSGGVLFNILGAFLLFLVVFMIGSNVYLEKNEVAQVPAANREMLVVDINEASPLKDTPIKLGSRIIGLEADGKKILGEQLNSFSASEFVQTNNNSQISINFKNTDSEEEMTVIVVPKAGIVEGKKILGAKFVDSTFKKYSLIEAIPEAAKTTYNQLIYIFVSLGHFVYDLTFKDAKVEDNLSGPVGLAVMTTKVSEKGLDQILIFAAMLSLSLAAFNILPIPALDGGRIIFVLMEAVKGKKVKAQTEQLFHGLGFLLLLCLMLFVTYFDIVKAIS